VRALLLSLAGLLGADARPGVERIAAQVQALELEPVRVGQRGELSLILLEAPDRALPLEVRLAADPREQAETLEFDENRLDWSAVVDPLARQPRVRASFRAPSVAGSYEVRARVHYSVCDEQWCRAKRGELRWTIVVVD